MGPPLALERSAERRSEAWGCGCVAAVGSGGECREWAATQHEPRERARPSAHSLASRHSCPSVEGEAKYDEPAGSKALSGTAAAAAAEEEEVEEEEDGAVDASAALHSSISSMAKYVPGVRMEGSAGSAGDPSAAWHARAALLGTETRACSTLGSSTSSTCFSLKGVVHARRENDALPALGRP